MKRLITLETALNASSLKDELQRDDQARRRRRRRAPASAGPAGRDRDAGDGERSR